MEILVNIKKICFTILLIFLKNCKNEIFIFKGTGKSCFVLYMKDKLSEEKGIVYLKLSKLRT